MFIRSHFPTQGYDNLLLFSSKSLIVLALIFRFTIPFELILCEV